MKFVPTLKETKNQTGALQEQKIAQKIHRKTLPLASIAYDIFPKINITKVKQKFLQLPCTNFCSWVFLTAK